MVAEAMQTPTLDKDSDKGLGKDIAISMPILFPNGGETISSNGNGHSKRRTKKPLTKSRAKPLVEGKLQDSRIELQSKASGHRAHLPTFPWEVGFYEIYDEVRRKLIRTPLTLLDITFPIEDDVGEVQVAQRRTHDEWSRWLTDTVDGHLLKTSNNEWALMHDVLVYWDASMKSPAAPDVTAIPRPDPTAEKNSSYVVGRDGPPPVFVVEITSRSTRSNDLDEKPAFYASKGVKEYLIIDMQTPKKKDWLLIGYRLGDGPYYQHLDPDDEEGFTFETVGLRFVPIGRERIDIYDSVTGERVLTPPEHRIWGEEQSVRADEAEATVKSEMAARIQAEIQTQAEAEARATEGAARLKAEELAKAEVSARLKAEELAKAEVSARVAEESARFKAEELAKAEVSARVAEESARLKAEERAKQETDARIQVEQEKLALEAELAQLRAQLGR